MPDHLQVPDCPQVQGAKGLWFADKSGLSNGNKGFPGGADRKESACNAEDLDSISGLGRTTGEGDGYSFQYSCWFSVIIFLTFHTVYGVLKVRMLKWFAIPFYSGPHFVTTLHHDPYVYWMGSKERRDLLLYLLHPLLFSLYKRESLAIYHGSLWVTKWWLWTAIESIWLRYTLWMILPFLP